MKYLVLGRNKDMVPPEAAAGILDGASAWAKKYTENGKLEAVWALAGVQGGGEILNVDSNDEVDAIMAEFPLGPFTKMEVFPIVDFNEAMQRAKQAVQAMAG